MKDLRSIYALPILRLGSRAKDRAADCLPARNRAGRPIFPAAADRQDAPDLVGPTRPFRLGPRPFGLGKRAPGAEPNLDGSAPRAQATPGGRGGRAPLRPPPAHRGGPLGPLALA